MKRYIIFCFIVLLYSCEDEVIGPTSFEGKVVYADDETPFNTGYINIGSNQYRVGTPDLLDFKRVIISDDGSFNVEFEQDENIDYFDIEIEVITYVDSIGFIYSGNYLQSSGLDCTPYNCDEIEPGKDYKNLLIKVPR
ncbi:hypothetical protein [Chondrinema litorale]|uniref:hypothetical protein n=1 Tax=Chondrinema litorale TaxID=2994555 RepID=UPI00254280F2|nr:hypothetical protein [Chondrinema litorale]UZR99805.1 hypothetical protein OQ292_38535 [Chondrinema litorale]